MVRLTVVPVIPLAWSEAKKAAAFAVSARVEPRRAWVLLANVACHCSQVTPNAVARASKASLSVLVSGMPFGRRPTTRMPSGASFADRSLVSASLAACAGG
jgi:hypothetical protein